MNMKEKIVIAVLRDIYETLNNEQAFNDLMIIQMKTDGYENLVNDYAEQIIKILSKKE